MEQQQNIIDMLKQLEDAKQSKKTNQVPLDMVDANNIPREAPLQYEFLCRIVGSLYIQHHHGIETMGERHNAIVKELQEQIRTLMVENRKLKEELENVSGNNKGSST